MEDHDQHYAEDGGFKAGKPSTGQSSGFKLPPPTAMSSGFKLPPPTAAVEHSGDGPHNTEHTDAGASVPLPPPTGLTGEVGFGERDSGMFTYSRPGTRAGNSSYYASPGSRMNTAYALGYGSDTSRLNTMGVGARPLTAFAIPEEHAGFEHTVSPAAAYAAAHRDGKPPPPSRGNLSTPVIELEERMQTAADREEDLEDEMSSPNGSGKTEFEMFGPDGRPMTGMYDGMDHDEMYKLEQNQDMLGDQEDPENFFEDEEDSPYPEVRASVSNYDDPEMPCLTFRAILLGVSFTLLGAAANTYFYLRYPAPLLTPIVVQIITYPLGAGLARIMPVTLFDTPKWLQKVGAPTYWSFNPGPFNIKEHTVIIIMANVGIAPSFTQSMLLALDKFYEVKTGFGYDILLLLSVNTVGFTFAGFCRRFLIWPAALIWPQTLVTCTLLNTFHAEDDDAGSGSLTRYRYFLYVFFGALVWYIVPGYLFIGLSAFSWVCWIAPRNPVVNQLFGVVTGLGMSSITFDWSQVAYIGSPLIVPWWAIANIFVGFIVLIWIFAPIMYYTNTWDLAYLPISVNAVFDRYGFEYNVTAVLTPDLRLDQEAYAAYSPMYFPSTYTAIYALAFALATSSLVHTILYYGPTMWQTFRDIKKAKTDIHAKLMSAYPDVPTWWYAITFVACAAFSIGFVEGYDTGLPVWGLLLAALVVAVYIIPGGYIYALSSQALTVNIIAEIIPSYLFRGQPIVNMLFKAFTVNTLQLGLYYIQDLKLGHYMKIPPRVTFSVQITATMLAAFIQAGMKEGLLKGVPDLCAADQAAGLSCPTSRAIFNSSIVWGLIGAKRIFGDGSPYSALLWALLVGAALPCLFWITSRYYKARWIRLVNIPVMLSGLVLIPQATGLNYASWFIFGFVFQYLLRRYRFRWWSKFSFITSAGLDSGTVISTLLVFFALQLPKNGGLRLNWWGNLVYRNTYDWLGYPYRIPPEEGFGRTSWH